MRPRAAAEQARVVWVGVRSGRSGRFQRRHWYSPMHLTEPIRVRALCAGTSEVQRLAIARAILRIFE